VRALAQFGVEEEFDVVPALGLLQMREVGADVGGSFAHEV